MLKTGVSRHTLCLGGEALDIGRDFWGSSITFPAGTERLPQVKRAYTTMR